MGPDHHQRKKPEKPLHRLSRQGQQHIPKPPYNSYHILQPGFHLEVPLNWPVVKKKTPANAYSLPSPDNHPVSALIFAPMGMNWFPPQASSYAPWLKLHEIDLSRSSKYIQVGIQSMILNIPYQLGD